MVVHSQEREESINRLFRALADGTRRDILARGMVDARSISDLAERYEMSFAAVQKHVAVLARAGLVNKHSEGRKQLVSTDRERLKRAGKMLDRYEAIWRLRMAQLDVVLQAREI